MGDPVRERVPAAPSSPMPATREGPGLGALLLLLGCALGAAGVVHMQHNCKKTLRTLAFERCSGYRDKRNEFASAIEGSDTRKRQITSIREIAVSPRVPIHDTPYPPVPSFLRHQSTPIVPPTDSDIYRATRRFEALPKESSSNLGFEINVEEMIELFNEIYERIPRSSIKTKAESLRKFMALAYECCKNQDLCLTKKELIPIHCI